MTFSDRATGQSGSWRSMAIIFSLPAALLGWTFIFTSIALILIPMSANDLIDSSLSLLMLLAGLYLVFAVLRSGKGTAQVPVFGMRWFSKWFGKGESREMKTASEMV